MALFALATSATPGPVNIISTMSGARFGTLRSLPYVGGATTSFHIILLLLGFGFHLVLDVIKRFSGAISLAGAAYMSYLAYKIATDQGDLSFNNHIKQQPGFMVGLIDRLGCLRIISGFYSGNVAIFNRIMAVLLAVSVIPMVLRSF